MLLGTQPPILFCKTSALPARTAPPLLRLLLKPAQAIALLANLEIHRAERIDARDPASRTARGAASDIVKDVRGSESNCEHDSR
jgi:hypothetical protein